MNESYSLSEKVIPAKGRDLAAGGKQQLETTPLLNNFEYKLNSLISEIGKDVYGIETSLGLIDGKYSQCIEADGEAKDTAPYGIHDRLATSIYKLEYLSSKLRELSERAKNIIG